MSEKEGTSIEKDKDQPITLDFKSLRDEGIALIQKLSGHIWTDYNLHDPGVTLLEMLCTAITDLAYRTDFPIQDLLADKNGLISSQNNTFFRKEDILTTNPISVNDFRMAIQDEVEDVYNVWLEPVFSNSVSDSMKGVYRIYIQMARDAVSRGKHKEETIESIRKHIKKSFVSKRNLCEDWERDIVILRPENIKINADIMVTGNAKSEDTLAKIYSSLENYLNPPVKYYSESELLEEGFTTEEIFSGPLLQKGFIPAIRIASRRKIIDPEEMIQKIMQIDGVINVMRFSLETSEGTIGIKPFQLGEFNFPYLLINTTLPSIRIIKGKKPAPIDADIFNDLLMKEQEVSKRNFISSTRGTKSAKPLKGTYREVEQYYSIQDHFPSIYGIGREGLPAEDTNEHKAQARQLKAYLMLFEQLLANFLSQLAHGKDLLSTDLTGPGASTYYSQPLYDIPDVKDLLKAFTNISKTTSAEDWKTFKENINNEYIRSLKAALENNRIYRERKNRVFDHLLARFNLKVEDYPVRLFNTLYGDPTIEERADDLLKWKSDLLNNLAELTHDRIKAFDYLKEPEESREYSGFQKGLSKLLYIQNMERRPLSWVFDLRKTSSGGGQQVNGLMWKGNQRNNPGSASDHPFLTSDSFDFGEQTIRIFKYGLDTGNYQITRASEETKDYQILYKDPEENHWNKIGGTHSTKPEAIRTLQALIRYLKQISIESEGFHIVEHLLLRPALKSNAFGFGFYETKNKLLFQHKQWSDFKGREEELQAITNNPPLDKKGKDRYLPLLKNLRSQKNQKRQVYPGFGFWTRISGELVINEAYFNSRMSVVFPSWPARFQEDNFRAFTEELFRAMTPAHVQINFFWMDIFEMKKFEKIYFQWLTSLKKTGDQVAEPRLSEKLILILKGEDYRLSGN